MRTPLTHPVRAQCFILVLTHPRRIPSTSGSRIVLHLVRKAHPYVPPFNQCPLDFEPHPRRVAKRAVECAASVRIVFNHYSPLRFPPIPPGETPDQL